MKAVIVPPGIVRTVAHIVRYNKDRRLKAVDDLNDFLKWLAPEDSAERPSDCKIVGRLLDVAPHWAADGVIPPVIYDDIVEVRQRLEAQSNATDVQRTDARDDLYRIIKDQYEIAGTPDLVTRQWRDCRRLLRWGYDRRAADRKRRIPRGLPR
ncbi:hypothetical protein AZH51_18425 [Branchiibius sp. NY16-3462-2]|nr:hypothetical protein AZH51_18425 [Branchiibius sp. NY16-3462-2]